MDEIRKNNTIRLQTRDLINFEGIVLDCIDDRILVSINESSLEIAKKIKELDLLLATVATHFGIKKMFSHVIDELSQNNCIIIENNDAVPIVQKRQFARVASNFQFLIYKEDEFIKCKCVNISGGGIAFTTNDASFEIGEVVQLSLSQKDFGKDIKTYGLVIKYYNNQYVLQFKNLNPHDENRIVQHVFKIMAKK